MPGKAAVGFLHAGEGSRVATDAALARAGYAKEVAHLVDPALVDARAETFPIDERRYAAMLARARELRERAERIVLSCSVYNGVAADLGEDLGIPVERGDAAAVRRLVGTQGTVGILVSFPPTRPVVVDYVAEVLAQAEEQREICASVAADAPPFATAPDVYRAALLAALQPLHACGVLLVAQYTMNEHLDALRAAWGPRPSFSALESVALELAAA